MYIGEEGPFLRGERVEVGVINSRKFRSASCKASVLSLRVGKSYISALKSQLWCQAKGFSPQLSAALVDSNEDMGKDCVETAGAIQPRGGLE